jgi:hypothetical protein
MSVSNMKEYTAVIILGAPVSSMQTQIWRVTVEAMRPLEPEVASDAPNLDATDLTQGGTTCSSTSVGIKCNWQL